jgi:hypothetical protein
MPRKKENGDKSSLPDPTMIKSIEINLELVKLSRGKSKILKLNQCSRSNSLIIFFLVVEHEKWRPIRSLPKGFDERIHFKYFSNGYQTSKMQPTYLNRIQIRL